MNEAKTYTESLWLRLSSHLGCENEVKLEIDMSLLETGEPVFMAARVVEDTPLSSCSGCGCRVLSF
jgi:hypothetical protein